MLTKDRLCELLHFNPDEGRFYWKAKVRGIKPGQQAGSFDAYGYGQVRINRAIYKEHHLVWLWMTGTLPSKQIDHINHDRRDNRPENLREADNVENHKNRPIQNNNKTGFVGVSIDKHGGYVSYITLVGKKIHLGRFKTLSEAIRVRKEANSKYGFHENHGVGYGIPKLKALKEASCG